MNFSVLMSLYIKEDPDNLRQCLSSIKDQTVQASEIIFVFDGALNDELESVVLDYQRSLPITCIRLPENRGLGEALNEGLRHCSSEWVFRMDTDDICFPNRFERQVKFIMEHPDIVLCGSHILEFADDIDEPTGIRKVPIEYSQIKKFALKRTPFNHVSIALKKNVVEEVGSYQHHMFLEDYNLWLRILALGYKVGNVDEVLVYVRAGANMLGRRRGREYVKSEWKLYKLKRSLKMQGLIVGFGVFFLRVVPRFLPVKILSVIYKTFLR